MNDNLNKVLSKAFYPERCERFWCRRQRLTQLCVLKTVEDIVLNVFSVIPAVVLHCRTLLPLDPRACLGTVSLRVWEQRLHKARREANAERRAVACLMQKH